MNYLLDTYTFLWLLTEPEKLPAHVQAILAAPATTLALSLVTPWEMAIKTGIGKLDAGEILDHFEAVVRQGRFTMLETTVPHVVRAGLLPLHHRDPFDRLLVAQSLELRIPIISRDPVFDRYGVERIWSGSGA